MDYDVYGSVTADIENKASSTSPNGRATYYAYTADEQLMTKTAVGGSGTATPQVTYAYDTVTRRQTGATSSAGTIGRQFDTNGRLKQYTDAAGTVTVDHYDLRGRLSSQIENGTRTRSYGYDDRDNLNSVTDPDMPVATASYDLDDNLLTENLGAGLQLAQTWDETDRVRNVERTKITGWSSNCLVAKSDVSARNREGNIVAETTNSTTEAFGYDTADRLTTDDKINGTTCVRRAYVFDGGGAGDSNRTTRSTTTSAAGGACGTGSTSSRILTYDTADRVSTGGWAWDAWDRPRPCPPPTPAAPAR